MTYCTYFTYPIFREPPKKGGLRRPPPALRGFEGALRGSVPGKRARVAALAGTISQADLQNDSTLASPGHGATASTSLPRA